MKKILTIILCVICLLGIVGCNKTEIKTKDETEEKKAEIVTNDGTKEQKSCSELHSLLFNNLEYYQKHYGGAKIKIVDKVQRIEDGEIMVLSDGCEVYFNKNSVDFSEILPGTKVEIEGLIIKPGDRNYLYPPSIEEPSLKILS